MRDPLFLKPAQPDLVVRDPITAERLPAAGDWKPDNSHWRRRLRAGDVVRAEPPAKAPDTKSKKEG